ncbi:MAG: LysM peptidoglycan-binding domain-containing protein [Clostridia bacterium]|nr:LysM peptidoglycan-binding domain-containing protein [Clostridia bacterium]MDD4376097.1 LysM peptidoglycan-binding domain-containing protein [Clostridia bacterium]
MTNNIDVTLVNCELEVDFKGTLQQGDSGEFIKFIQQKLKKINLFPGTITGSFGISTALAVSKFQETMNITPNGIVDEHTWNALFSSTNSPQNLMTYCTLINPVLQLGDAGEIVADLQNKLKSILYYSGEITSVFDVKTEKAVKQFQLNNNILAVGIVCPKTWNTLNFLYAVPSTSSQKEDFITYVVKSGDTLYSIANEYGTTVNDIMLANNLSYAEVVIGQNLLIPNKHYPLNIVQYIVRPNDTLESIAKSHNTCVQKIIDINNLENSEISTGLLLLIPANQPNCSPVKSIL